MFIFSYLVIQKKQIFPTTKVQKDYLIKFVHPLCVPNNAYK